MHSDVGDVHLEDEQVQRVVHGELAPPAAAPVREHLAGCPDCRSRVAGAEWEETRVLDLLRHLDHRPPRVHVATVVARRGRGLGWGRWAAGVLVALGVAGAALYAAPGSSLRGAVGRLFGWVDRTPPVASPPPREQAPESSGAPRGIAVTPGDQFTIAFSSDQPGGAAAVSLADGTDDVVVRALGGTASFTSDVDRLSIDNAGSSARFEIQIPRAAPRVEIRVAGRRVFLKDGTRVQASGRQDAAGRYLLPLTCPSPSPTSRAASPCG